MRITRRKAKAIKIGKVYIGGNNPVAIQSMAKTATADIAKTTKQIKELQGLGCEIIRLAVKDNLDASALKKIKGKVTLPIVADIHFSYRLGLLAIDSGADKIRLNPANIYKTEEIREIARAAKSHHIPIRVGLNSGSIRGHQVRRSGGHQVTPAKSRIVDNMVKSALDYIRILERCGFYDIVVSLKSSDIFDTIEAYRKIAKLCNYPLHLGVTATGSPYSGLIKSSIALSTLLSEGIGDTIRISLTDQPQEEVRAAKVILESLGLRRFSPQIISCPTCGRCTVDLVRIVKDLEEKLSAIRYPLSARLAKVAVMGCVVNGPGEAREADIGIAFGGKDGLLFRNGKPLRKISPAKCVEALLDTICKFKDN